MSIRQGVGGETLINLIIVISPIGLKHTEHDCLQE